LTAACPDRRLGWLGASATIVVALAASITLHAQGTDQTPEPLGPPPLYDALRNAALEPAGHIINGRLVIDRVVFELDEGDLYLLPVEGRVVAAVYLGDGTLRLYPPDGAEHHQVQRLSNDDLIEDEFERFVFWFTGTVGEDLRALTDGVPASDVNRAADLLTNRREALLEDQLANPDGRLLMDLWRSSVSSLSETAPYFFAQVDGRDHDWLSIEVEPRRAEEVRVTRYDSARRGTDVWLSANAMVERASDETTPTGFPRDPTTLGTIDGREADEWSFRDLGLSPRPWVPGPEAWTPRVGVPRVDVDLALEGNGDARGTAAMVVDPLIPLTALRLQISPLLDVTDVRWRGEPPDSSDEVGATVLLEPGDDPAEPAPLIGEPVYFVQAKHDRRVGEDLYEPWLTVLLPREVSAGERIIIEVGYEGELVERLRETQDYLLRDTLNWMPRHPDVRLTRFGLTFRVPEEYRVTSGGELVWEAVEDDTRILRWVTDRPARAMMAFHYGRFEVSAVEDDGVPPIAVWFNRNRLGFAPGNREETIETLLASLRTFSDYFGPYPFEGLTVTETPSYGAQAFPGLVLLSFQAFGDMNSSAAAFLRAHEVAHQWWGASIGWESYRDQWIPEGFAHYSAALFVLHNRDEPGEFAEMVDTWRRDVTGEVTLSIGRGRAYYGLNAALIRRSDGHEAGPLVAGYRLATSEKPMEYQLLAYEKGALVLHMLRAMLLDPNTGDDNRFLTMMRAFADAHTDGVASTAAFEETVSEAFGEPMSWFFDQWVYGTEVPTYRPDLDVVATGDAAMPFALRGTIRQEDVFDGFRMPVPIALTFEDRPNNTHVVWVDASEIKVDIPLAARPERVDVNAGNAVLARIR
jgi:hypothetical protein